MNSYTSIPERINWPEPDLWPPDDLVRLIQPHDCPSGRLHIRAALDEWSSSGLISPTGTIFDLGCGYGRIPCCLKDYLTTGQYIGFDVYGPFIHWLKSAFANDDRYRFIHIDIGNSQYNTEGRDEFHGLPIDTNSVDTVIAISLFSHIKRELAQPYFAELRRIVKPGGKMLLTMFRTDDPTRCVEWDNRVVRLRSEWESTFAFNGLEIIDASGGDNELELFHDQWWVTLQRK